MGLNLTITDIKDSGKVDNFGNHKCYVTFEDEDGVVKEDVYAAFKEVPAVGTKRFGNIIDGEYGPRFKSEQQEGYQAAPKAAGSAPSKKTGSSSSYNQDGARQGMAINNAASYVIGSAVKDSITLDPQELADEIKRYARPIYLIDPTEPLTSAEDVLDIMGK